MTHPPRRSANLVAGHSPRIVGAFLGACLLTLTACGGSGENPTRANSTLPAPVPKPSPSPSSTTDPDVAAVAAAYDRSWKAQIAAYAKASSAETDLRKSTTAGALLDIESDLKAMRKAGQVTTGTPALHPQAPKLSTGEIPRATLTDCVDTTGWTLVDETTRKKIPLPAQRLTKYVSIATLEKWGTTWMVTKLSARDQAC